MSSSRAWAVLLSALVPFLPAGCHLLHRNTESCGEIACDDIPVSHKNPSMESIARDLDHIEQHIDAWGSIATKHPDIWGAARLTKYQVEVETIFAEDAKAANVKEVVKGFQGARAITDQAFLASALALNAAITGGPAILTEPDPITVVTGQTLTKVTDNTKRDVVDNNMTTVEANKLIGQETKNAVEQKFGTNTAQTVNSDNTNERKAEIKAPKTIDTPTNATIPEQFKTFVETKMDVKRNEPTIGKMPGFGADGLTLEPTVVLDQKKRFLEHLNEIRRVNEGDDTADSPGYALYLVRVPVSVLPGKRTDTGHGAEIAMSIKPILGDDLLPLTFRNLVINDLVDQFSELVTVALNTNRKELIEALRRGDTKGYSETTEVNDAERAALRKILRRAQPKYVSARPSRNAEYAFPMNQLEELFGETYVKALIVAALTRYDEEIRNDKVIHIQNVRSVVREQIVAGYRFISTGNPHIWSVCTNELARAARDLNGDKRVVQPILEQLKDQYDDVLGREISKDSTLASDRLVMKAFGWAILVQSALLNELLVRDIKETMTNKGFVPPTETWQDYFMPEPSPEARRVFNEYVACRWPLYTFAVDPVTEQQNIQDTVSQRREMQLALAVSLASGNISANSFTRMARRLEADYQTIQLNRTVVGFSHGDNTFGWRFYPRFQTPNIPGTVKVLGKELIGGLSFTHNTELRQQRLEPGQRECTALVVMPSFVPFAEINVSSHWFNLANPKHKSHSTHETVVLSRRLKAVETCNIGCDQDRYLAGEYGRLQAKAKMLGARLPLQDMKFQVPYENTVGGFEFFNSGITDLAPQLRGWYGAEGYAGKELDLFLMGDKFTIANTKLIAGGKEIPPGNIQLLSRQVVSVKLPADLVASEDKSKIYSESGLYIDIRLATPYGIGGPLRVPVLAKPTPPTVPPPVISLSDGKVLISRDRDTDVIITGANFTPDTQAVAGGKSCVVTVLSPTVVKITVPKDVQTLQRDGKDQVEIKIATPSGVSNVLAIPMIPAPETTPPKKADATFTTPTLMVAFRYKNLGIEGVEPPNQRPQSLTIQTDADTKITAKSVDVEFTTPVGAVKLEKIAFDSKTRKLADLSALLIEKLLKECANRYGPENLRPIPEMKLTAKIKPDGGSEIAVTGELLVQWISVKPAK